MGVAPVAVVAFLGLAAIGWYAMVDEARHAARQEVREADLGNDARDDARRQTSIRFDSVSYASGPKRLTITMTNLGEANLDAGKVDVLLDGVWRTSDVYSRKVDNFNSEVWSPDTQLVLLVQNVNANPARDVIVTEEGYVAIYER